MPQVLPTRPNMPRDLPCPESYLSLVRVANMATSESYQSHTQFAAKNPVTLMDLGVLCNEEWSLLIYLMKSGPLGDFSGTCRKCDEGTVVLIKHGQSFIWQCNLQRCRKITSIRTGSFFSGSHLSFKSILVLIHSWIHELPQKMSG